MAWKHKTPRQNGQVSGQVRSVSRPLGSLRGHEGPFSRYPLPLFFSFSAGGLRNGQERLVFLRPAFFFFFFACPRRDLLSKVSLLQDGSAEAVVESDTPEPCTFPSPDSCHKTFLLASKEDHAAPRPVVGHVLRAGNAETFLQALGLESLDLFFFFLLRASKRGEGGEGMSYTSQRGRRR